MASRDFCLVIGPDAAEWVSRLSAVPELNAWEFRSQPEVAKVVNIAASPELALVLVTAPSILEDERLRAWLSRMQPPRRPALAVIGQALPHTSDVLAFPAEGWRQWTPSLHLQTEAVHVRVALAQFADLGGPEFVGEMTELLLRQTPEQFTLIDKALAAGDLTTAQRIAHSMKSSFGNFGARRCQRLATAMDLAAREGRGGDYRNEYDALRGEYDTFRGILAKFASDGTQA